MQIGESLRVQDGAPAPLGLSAGPHWRSFERLRIGGPRELDERLAEDAVGRLQTKEHEYVIVRAETFTRLFGLGQEIDRLRRGAELIRQAATLGERAVSDADNQLAFRHVSDLIGELLTLPAETTVLARPAAVEVADEMDDATDTTEYELDPSRIERPVFRRE